MAYASLLALVGPECVHSAAGQIDPMLLQKARRVAQTAASGFETYEYELGAGEAAARPSTRKAWAAAFKIPGQSNVAAAGFKLPPISAAGTISGARVKASFSVSQVVGTGLTLVLQVAATGVAGSQHKASTPLTGPGSYTVTTDPFSLLEGGQYQAKAFVNAWAGSTEGDLCAAVLTITEIKWEF